MGWFRRQAAEARPAASGAAQPLGQAQGGEPAAGAADDPDVQRLARVAQGGPAGEQALDELVEVYEGSFMRSLRRRGLSHADADDVMQTFWETVWKCAGDYGPNHGRPVQWLMTILKFKCADSQRHSHRSARRLVPLEGEAADAHDADRRIDDELEQALVRVSPEGPDRAVDGGRLSQCVKGALTAFKRDNADLMDLLYRRLVDGIELDDLARLRGIGTHTLENYLTKARALFRPLVKPCLQWLEAS